MKPRLGIVALTALMAAASGDKVVVDMRTPRPPHPADSLPPPFRDNEKIRAAEAKRERRRKRGW